MADLPRDVRRSVTVMKRIAMSAALLPVYTLALALRVVWRWA
jgi:hypothetical protein